MHYLLFIVASLFLLAIVPLKIAVAICVMLVLITGVVKFSAQIYTSTSVLFADAFKAVSYAFFFLVVALFTLLSFQKGTGISQFSGLPALGVLAGLFSAFAIGFELGLGTTFGASAIIALISTVISGVLLWIVKLVL
jgi:hypothetical protein